MTVHSRKQDESQKQVDFKKAATLIVELLEERGLVPFQYKRRVIFDVEFLLKKVRNVSEFGLMTTKFNFFVSF